jgi:hypothetical protein
MDFIFGATLTDEDKLAIIPYSLPQLLEFHSSAAGGGVGDGTRGSEDEMITVGGINSGGLPFSLRHAHSHNNHNNHSSVQAVTTTATNAATTTWDEPRYHDIYR